MGGQLVHTVCMQTKDAVSRAEGEFTMQLACDKSKLSAAKVMLGSLEFPIVQWTIEEEWAYVYYSEGYRPRAEEAHLHIVEQVDGVSNDLRIRLPLYLNKIVRLERAEGQMLRVTCAHTHGLWTPNGAAVLGMLAWCDVQMICGPFGRISLTTLHRLKRVHRVSDDAFEIPLPSGDVAASALSSTGCSFAPPATACCGYVHVPAYPSIDLLCDALSCVIQRSAARAAYAVEYDARANTANLVVHRYPPGAESLHVQINRTALSSFLGYHSAVHEKRLVCGQSRGAVPLMQVAGGAGGAGDPLPCRLPSDMCTTAWARARMEPGWYAPSQRPFCTGQPLRFAQELESALNRLYFPAPERIPAHHCTGHFLVFTDPTGTTHMCPVMVGRYDIHTLCAHLERCMSEAASAALPGTAFAVAYAEQRVRFACSVEEEDGVTTPAVFTLNFDHPAQFDPARIGFSAVPMAGAHAYASESIVVVPDQPPKNLYRATEISHQKRLRIHTVPLPPLTCVLRGYCASTSVAVLETHLGQVPFAHGFAAGDVVQIGRCAPSELLALDRGRGRWAPRAYEPCDLAPLWGRSGVVMPPAADADDVGARASAGASPLILRVRVTRVPELCTRVGTIVHVQPCAEPFSFNFGLLPRSLPAQMVGFPVGAAQRGADGSPRGDTSALALALAPPLDAPHVHSLDHPDYVLMYLSEKNMGKSDVLLQHANGHSVTAPFAKLVLYPMLREERMLPRDTMLTSQATTLFTVRFTNPDGTPYHFHGANFSISLNFVSV